MCTFCHLKIFKHLDVWEIVSWKTLSQALVLQAPETAQLATASRAFSLSLRTFFNVRTIKQISRFSSQITATRINGD